jgi:hypothetical protein
VDIGYAPRRCVQTCQKCWKSTRTRFHRRRRSAPWKGGSGRGCVSRPPIRTACTGTVQRAQVQVPAARDGRGVSKRGWTAQRAPATRRSLLAFTQAGRLFAAHMVEPCTETGRELPSNTKHTMQDQTGERGNARSHVSHTHHHLNGAGATAAHSATTLVSRTSYRLSARAPSVTASLV